MKKVNFYIVTFIAFVICFTACVEKQYVVKSIEGSRVEMDSTWDAKADPEMVALVNSYKTRLEAEMNVEVGIAVQTLKKGYPQSLLTNFTADAMKEIASKKWGAVDFAVVNNGGLRSTLNEGIITVGNLYEIYSFDNELVLIDVPGKAVKSFFNYIAINGGEGLSSGIKLVIKDKKVKSLLIGGKPLDPNKTYRIATLDYLAQGNGGMADFARSTKYTDSHQTLRELMIEYVKEKTNQNVEIDAKLDDRIIKE